MRRGKKGINWVKNLSEYAKCLNNEKREELGWRSPFEVYYGRKSNELLKCGIPKDTTDDVPYLKLKSPSENQIRKHLKQVKNSRKKARACTEKINKRTMQYHKKKHQCSQYEKGEKVFVNYGKKGNKGYKARHVLLGRVIKRVDNGNRYYVKITNPTTEKVEQRWYSVEDFFSITMKGKKRKCTRKNFLFRYPAKTVSTRWQIKDMSYHMIHQVMGIANFMQLPAPYLHLASIVQLLLWGVTLCVTCHKTKMTRMVGLLNFSWVCRWVSTSTEKRWNLWWPFYIKSCCQCFQCSIYCGFHNWRKCSCPHITFDWTTNRKNNTWASCWRQRWPLCNSPRRKYSFRCWKWGGIVYIQSFNNYC